MKLSSRKQPCRLKDLGHLAKRLLEQLPADKLHAGKVERAFPEVALERNGDAAVAVEIAVPLAVFGVGKMGVSPVVNQRVPAGIFFLTG